MKIWAHTLVKNEERYLWYAVASVVEYVDRVMLWDTGSSDHTQDIIKALIKNYPGKIEFKEVGDVDINEFTSVRQRMLEETNSDWFMILDGDEVWWDKDIREMTDMIRENGNKLDSTVCRYINLVGDIYHYQDASAGKYTVDGNRGNITIRFVNRKIDGLHFGRPHGQQGIFDKNETLVQELPKLRRKFIDENTYLHFTHLPRSVSKTAASLVPKREMKLKFDVGHEFPLNYYFPEVFFRLAPSIVPSPWEVRDSLFTRKAYMEHLPKMIKRKFVVGSSGY